MYREGWIERKEDVIVRLRDATIGLCTLSIDTSIKHMDTIRLYDEPIVNAR